MGLRKLLVDFLFLVFCSTESSGRLPLHFPLWKVPASAGSSLSRVLSFSLSLCCILLCLAQRNDGNTEVGTRNEAGVCCFPASPVQEPQLAVWLFKTQFSWGAGERRVQKSKEVIASTASTQLSCYGAWHNRNERFK